MDENNRDPASYLDGLRVLELADETGEYAGKVLVGLGADVVKVEPLAGESTRHIGPFREHSPPLENSLHFWHYNHGKSSVALDLDTASGQGHFRELALAADVLIDTRSRTYLEDRGIGFTQLRGPNPALIYARITPFGDTGPWADFKGSDLVHLALGGVMMNCGYDPDPLGRYDTPPIAPQMWHAYHIAGEVTVIAILGALAHRLRTGAGQSLCTSIHTAVSMNTETDLPDWVYLRQPHFRQTCRHSMTSASTPALSITKDGRYILPYRTYLKSAATYSSTAPLQAAAVLAKYNMDEGLHQAGAAACSAAESKLSLLIDRLSNRLLLDADLWRDGQEHGLPWAPVRRPEENVKDPHWTARGTFARILHPQTQEHYTYVGSRWYSAEAPWKVPSERPPRLGEHTATVTGRWAKPRPRKSPVPQSPFAKPGVVPGPTGKPFALSGVLVVDLGWMLASAGAGRYLASMGADVIKVEHEGRIDGLRFGQGGCPPGGRAERNAATQPINTPPRINPNRSGAFMEVNAGKQALSLDLKSAKGKQILEDLIRRADIIVEGFSPGTMQRMGLGYDRLKQLNPGIIYAQQSGLGEYGQYGRTRAFGPTAQAFSGISDMSGLPEPYPPAGIGYSYLDWFGAYNLATAMLAALYRRATTGLGCHIDASQTEMGLFLTGTAVLNHSVNGKRWSRYGNRSPYKPAAPHGAYRTAGADNWIAIGTFTEDQWRALATQLQRPEWLADPRFASLDARHAHEDLLDEWVNTATADHDGVDLMYRLQAAGVPAGVCQSAEDRCENDPQLRHQQWLIELPQTEMGLWPVKDFPVRMAGTPAHPGGIPGRSGPNYGEDTERVLSRVLGMTPAQIAALRAERIV